MRGDTSHMDLAGAKVDKKQDVVRYQPTQRPDLGREEVGGHQHLHMRADELLPGGGRLAFWRWGNAMAFEDVAHGLVTDRVPEVREGADNSIVAPGAILLGQANDQRRQRWIDGGTPWSLALRGAVKLLGHKFAVPAKNRVGLDDRGHLLEGLPT